MIGETSVLLPPQEQIIDFEIELATTLSPINAAEAQFLRVSRRIRLEVSQRPPPIS